MKNLLRSLWEDPHAAMGALITLLSIAAVLLTYHGPLLEGLGLALGQLSGSALLWRAKVPGTQEPTHTLFPTVTVIPPNPYKSPLVALLLALAIAGALLCSGDVYAAETKTSTAAPASKLQVSIYAQAAVLHFDGTMGVGPSGCLGYRASPVIFPVVCVSLEAAKSSAGLTGRLGPQIGVVVPGLEAAFGLKVPPCFTFGWSLFRLGPGDLIDWSKGALLVAGSFPFLGL